MEPRSKLALARSEQGLTQAQVAETIGVEIHTVCRWERGTSQPFHRHIVKLCRLFGKSAQELGLIPETEDTSAPSVSVKSRSLESIPPSVSVKRSREENTFATFFRHDIELRLQYLVYDWLHCRPSGSYATLQYRINQELEDYDSMTKEPSRQHSENRDMTRRTALRHLALLPIHALGLDSLGVTPQWVPEDILPHCAAGITACEQLSKGVGEDMSLAYSVLSTYLPPLKEIVEQSSKHRKESARLVAQALLIKATLSIHREGPKRAINYGKQAEIYSKESGIISLRLAILKRLAWMYACDKQEKQALEKVLQAKVLLQKQQKSGIPIHPTLQSSILGGVAKYQARNGQDDDARIAIHEAYDTFFAQESLGDDVATTGDDFNYSTLIMEDGLTYYYLDQYEKALEVFAQAVDLQTLEVKVPASSERVRIEIINNETLASLKSSQKNMELSIKLWMAGIQGAIDLHSEQRFSEALTAYNIMQALWPGDKRIKELREFTRHW